MKLAVSGKGGVGKTTIAAALALLMARRGQRVLAVDADPDANLASALGVPAPQREGIVPISQQKALIEQRTGAKVKQYGQIFKINPEVSDIADNFALEHDGVSLLVLGAVDRGGSGCACPEGVLLQALVSDLVLHKDDALVLDMDAGVEHLGRATARGVDAMLVVVEPGQRSIDCAKRVHRMAEQIGIKRVLVVANKVASPQDEEAIRSGCETMEVLGMLPFSDALRRTDRAGKSVLGAEEDSIITGFNGILDGLLESIRPGRE